MATGSQIDVQTYENGRSDKVYGAFLSYSHKSEHSAALRIQSGLQRLAKPRGQPWALRVFRDETDLAANPGFWPRIKRALSNSHYFVLMASPGSATSKWVRRELCYWLTNGFSEDDSEGWQERIDPGRALRILIVLAAGSIAWDDEKNDFDWQVTTCLPNVLSGVFQNEPLWVVLPVPEMDADQAKVEFMRAVARLSVPIRFGDSEELEEHARELLDQDYLAHEKTIRLTRITAVILAMLALAAVAAGAIAEFQRREAEVQRNIAEGQRQEAIAQKTEAEKQQHIATEEKRTADEQRALAVDRAKQVRSNALAVTAAALPDNLEAALVLSESNPDVEPSRGVAIAAEIAQRPIPFAVYRHQSKSRSSLNSAVFTPDGRHILIYPLYSTVKCSAGGATVPRPRSLSRACCRWRRGGRRDALTHKRKPHRGRLSRLQIY